MSKIMYFVIAVILSFLAGGAEASTQGAPVDWVTKWGTIDVAGDNDSVIPTSRHNVKRDIKFSLQYCKPTATPAEYAKNKIFEIDFDADGLPDVVEDTSILWPGEQLATCPTQICTAEGCNTPLYHNDGDTQIIIGAPAPDNPCPRDAGSNNTCREECPALESQCPGLFNHARSLVWVGRTLSWSFLTVEEFASVRDGIRAITPGRREMYRDPVGASPIFRAERDPSNCTNEEMDPSGSGVITAGTPCIKYLQFTSSVSVCGIGPGCFIDLYRPEEIVSAPDTRDRFIVSPLNSAGRPTAFFDSKFAQSGRGMSVIDGVDIVGKGFKLPAQTALAAQIAEFNVNATAAPVCNDVQTSTVVCDGASRQIGASDGAGECHTEYQTKRVCAPAAPKSEFACYEYVNRSSKALFIPAQTDQEYGSFIGAVTHGKMADVSVRECERKFTPWIGVTSCASIYVACNQSVSIAAERTCQRSTSATASCSECAGNDTEVIPGFRDACFFSAICQGPPCPRHDPGLCLDGNTRVTLANHHTRRLRSLKTGDLILGFDMAAPLGAPHPVRVKAVTRTNNKEVMAINGLKLTPNHKVIVEGGIIKEARDVVVSDKLIEASGAARVISKIVPPSRREPVYNLILDEGGGFIADGVRVLDYVAHE